MSNKKMQPIAKAPADFNVSRLKQTYISSDAILL